MVRVDYGSRLGLLVQKGKNVWKIVWEMVLCDCDVKQTPESFYCGWTGNTGTDESSGYTFGRFGFDLSLMDINTRHKAVVKDAMKPL